MQINHPDIGICGLSCKLCPNYQTEAASRCQGCKSPDRMALGCPFITCAIKRKHVEFCWECDEHPTCDRWARHREAGKNFDSFKCYQKLEDDIRFIMANGVESFRKDQFERETLLRAMLGEFNDGRSKSHYCIACTVLEISELQQALGEARLEPSDGSAKEKAKALHAKLDTIAKAKQYHLKLRKP